MLIHRAGLEACENVERLTQEAHGAKGHVVDRLLGLLMRHLSWTRHHGGMVLFFL